MYSSEQLFFDEKYFAIHEPDFFYSGAIYGAISEPDSSYALKKAEELYAEIRKRTTDVQRIYHNINGVLSLDEIKEIKNYLFYDDMTYLMEDTLYLTRLFQLPKAGCDYQLAALPIMISYYSCTKNTKSV